MGTCITNGATTTLSLKDRTAGARPTSSDPVTCCPREQEGGERGLLLPQEDQRLSPSHDFVRYHVLQLGLCTEVAVVTQHREHQQAFVWDRTVMVGLARTEQRIHWEHQLLQAGGQGLMGTEVPPASSEATAGHQTWARAGPSQHIQCCLLARIREQAPEYPGHLQQYHDISFGKLLAALLRCVRSR